MSFMNHVFDPKKHKRFTPINRDKYKGDILPICRSSWEEKFYHWCDMNGSITSWVVESIAVEYFDPVKRKNRRYYPDVIMAVKDQSGRDVVYVVEIKPYKESVPPTLGKNKKDKTLLRESTTFQTNMAKWRAAELYCKKHGYIFRVLTERDLFKDGKV
jgi:hypothetical protein